MSGISSAKSQTSSPDQQALAQFQFSQLQQAVAETLVGQLREQTRDDAARLALNQRLAETQALANAQLRARIDAQQVLEQLLDFDLQPGSPCAEANPLSDRQIVSNQRAAEASWFDAATRAGSADTTAAGSSPAVAMLETPRR